MLATVTEQTSDTALKPSEGRFRARFEVTFPNEPATSAPADVCGAGRGRSQTFPKDVAAL